MREYGGGLVAQDDDGRGDVQKFQRGAQIVGHAPVVVRDVHTGDLFPISLA